MQEKANNEIIALAKTNQREQSRRVKLVLNFNLSQIFPESFGHFTLYDFGCGLITWFLTFFMLLFHSYFGLNLKFYKLLQFIISDSV